MNTISIPDARDQLREWAEEWDKPDLKTLADAMYRKAGANPKTEPTSVAMTNEIAHKIRKHKRLNPSCSNQDLAEIYKVNAGRVSEALNNSKTWRI